MKNKAKIIAACVLVLSALCGCRNDVKTESIADSQNSREVICQVGLLQSLTLGYYDGFIPAGELLQHGDTGLGTFNGVNGEMIVLDGVMYQALGDGTVVVTDSSEMIPFATVTPFDADYTVKADCDSLDELRRVLDEKISESGVNQFYMARIDCTCKDILVRSELLQENPYRPLNEVLKTDQREFSYENAEGTIVAIYCPAYMDGLNTPGWHFHFISTDRTKGGHILSLSGLSGEAGLDMTSGFEMYLDDTAGFNGLSLEQNLSEQIKEVEG